MSRAKNRQAAMAFILVTLFLDILGIGIIVPILPELVKEFMGGDAALAGRYVGIIAATYALMQFFFAPILGALSDRFGRRPVILVSLFGLGIDYLLQGWAPSIGWLFLGRAIAGVMGASITTANAYIADVSTPENRARNFGLVGVAFGLGFIMGPALGGLLGGISLRLPFYVSAALVMINWLYGFFVLPESLPPEKRGKFEWKNINPMSSIGNLRKYPIVAGLAVAFVLISMSQRGLENVWVLYTGYRYGWDEMTNGLALALVGVTAVIVQGFLVKPVVSRIGERRAILFGLGLSVFSYIGYGLASEGWMIIAVIVGGSIAGVAGPAINGMVAGAVSPSEQGRVQGSLTALVSVTNIVAPLIFTTGLFSYFTSERAPVELPGAPFFLGALCIFAAWMVVLRLFGRLPPPEEREAAVPENEALADEAVA